jgi:hypothetical protein
MGQYKEKESDDETFDSILEVYDNLYTLLSSNG